MNAGLRLGITEVFEKINKGYPQEGYDHRPFLNVNEKQPAAKRVHMTELFRIEYACFKYEVAAVLEPNSIIEIGVRTGISALAFLHARKKAAYLGIDNNLDGNQDGIDYVGGAKDWFDKLGFNTKICIEDSLKLKVIPFPPDLMHIDGCHSRKGVAWDVGLALRGKAYWILVDDAGVSDVCSGLNDSVFQELGGIAPPMCRFDQTYGQNVLIRNPLADWTAL